jgi:hypothetical protein
MNVDERGASPRHTRGAALAWAATALPGNDGQPQAGGYMRRDLVSRRIYERGCVPRRLLG